MRRLPRALRAVLVVAAALTTAPPSAPAVVAKSPAVEERLPGINPEFLPEPTSVAARRQAFDRMRQAGIRIGRIDGNWARVERQVGVYDWSELDHKVDELVRYGMRPRIKVDYSNPLYSRAGTLAQSAGNNGFGPFGAGQPIYFPPDTPAPFARWAAALARHYRGKVHLLEIWNEQNLGWRFWEPHEDPAAYGALLRATYTAIKQVAPEDQVAFGGTFYPAVDIASADATGIPIPNDPTARQLGAPHQGTLSFVANALAADPTLGNYFDAMAYHPYHFPYFGPDVDVPVEGTLESSMVALRGLLQAHGLGAKPIWITEVGWPNNVLAYGATAKKIASYLVRTYVTAWANHIEQVDWYCYGDGGPDSAYNQEGAFGIVDANGVPKPAYHAWKTLDQLVGSLPYAGSQAVALGLPSDGHAQRFGRGGTSVTVVWLSPETMYTDQGALAPATQEARVPTPAGTTAIYDMIGNPLPVGATFLTTPYPVYLVRAAVELRGPQFPDAPGALPNTSR